MTDEEPNASDYDLLVITSDTLGDGNALGFPAVDCGNGTSNHVNVLFLSAKVEFGTSKRAIAVSKFSAERYGLEGLEGGHPDDLINRFIAATNNGATFTDTCLGLDISSCEPAACAVGQQNASARLSAAFN